MKKSMMIVLALVLAVSILYAVPAMAACTTNSCTTGTSCCSYGTLVNNLCANGSCTNSQLCSLLNNLCANGTCTGSQLCSLLAKCSSCTGSSCAGCSK
jgi:competence protein ComGC